MKYSFFENDQIFLRACEPEDLDIMYEIENDISLWTVASVTVPFSKYALKQYIINSQNDLFVDHQLRLMVCCKIDKRVVGIIDLSDFDPFHNRAAVGIVILEEYRERGYAKESLLLLKNYCFEYLSLKQLYAYIPIDNISSFSLFTSCEFTQTGLLKDWIRDREEYKDAFLMQLINS